MGGKTKSKSTSKQSSASGSGQAWAAPYATSAADAVTSVYGQNQGGLQGLTDMIRNQVVPGLQGQADQWGSLAGQGAGYMSDVLSGKYLNNNPELQHVIDSASGDIVGAGKAVFSRNGRYGSEAHQGVTQKQVGDMASGLRFQDYNNQMGRMDLAAQYGQQGSASNMSQLLAALAAGAELPYTGTNNLSNSLGALFNGGTSIGTSKSIEKGPGLFASLLANAAQGATTAAMASERRVKDNIVKIGEFADGLGKYSYTYKKGLGLPEGEFIGVMVDEVAQLRPHALGPVVDGIQTVNYAAL